MRQCVCWCAVFLAGCRVEPSFDAAPDVDAGSKPAAAADDDAPAPAAAGGSTGSDGSGGMGGSKSVSGTHAAATPSGAPTPADAAAGEGGAAPADAPTSSDPVTPSAACDAQEVTLDEIRAGAVRSNARVRLDAVATSQKFLVSHSSSGRCLFGAFVGGEPAPDGPRGALVVAYGADAPQNQPCAPGHDAIPDDLTPGDAVSAIGYATTYAPGTCGSVTPAPQLMVDSGCSLARAARRVLPVPYVLSPDEATRLATGTDAAFVRRFAGGLVRLENVSTVRPSEGTGSVGPYGVVRFAETSLELHNDLEYGDLTLGGPGDGAKSLAVAYPATFTTVTGLVYLDYCTWALAPRSRCTDLDPASDNCR